MKAIPVAGIPTLTGAFKDPARCAAATPQRLAWDPLTEQRQHSTDGLRRGVLCLLASLMIHITLLQGLGPWLTPKPPQSSTPPNPLHLILAPTTNPEPNQIKTPIVNALPSGGAPKKTPIVTEAVSKTVSKTPIVSETPKSPSATARAIGHANPPSQSSTAIRAGLGQADVSQAVQATPPAHVLYRLAEDYVHQQSQTQASQRARQRALWLQAPSAMHGPAPDALAQPALPISHEDHFYDLALQIQAPAFGGLGVSLSKNCFLGLKGQQRDALARALRAGRAGQDQSLLGLLQCDF